MHKFKPTNFIKMKTKHLFPPPVMLLLIILLFVPHAKVWAQEDLNRRLNVAVNGFELDEAAAKKALANGADINQKNEAMGDETLLITAIKGFKEAKVIKFLLDNGANPNIRDHSGKTALDWAEQYRIGKDNNGREILKLLGSRSDKTATAQNGSTKPLPKQTGTPANRPTTVAVQNKTVTGGPSINQIRQTLEKNLTTAYENHFYGVKNRVTFEWIGGIMVGQPERRLRLAQLCYPVKLNVKVTATDPRDGNTSTVFRGTEAEIAGYRKTEIFCFFKNGFGEWEYGTYEQ